MFKKENKNKLLPRDNGVAGLTVLLSVITMLFIIGFLIVIFVIVGSNLATNQYVTQTTSFTNQSTATTVNASNNIQINTVDPALSACALTITLVHNTTGAVISSGNYTTSGCRITSTGLQADGNNATSHFGINNSIWNVTGSFSYRGDTQSTIAINQTTNALSGVTTWFPVIITISVMVALILLTVIIIVAIRSSGLLAAGQ